MSLGCVACGAQLGEKADLEAMLCEACAKKRDTASQKKRVLEWDGILTEQVVFPLEKYLNKNMHVDFYVMGEPIDDEENRNILG